MKILSWDRQIIDNVSVYCSTQLIDEISTLRKADLTKETGGCLFGCYDKDAKIYTFFINTMLHQIVNVLTIISKEAVMVC